eukprot:247706_1
MLRDLFVQIVLFYVIIELLSHTDYPAYLSFKELIYNQTQSYLQLLNDTFSPDLVCVLLLNSTVVTFWIYGGIYLYFDLNDNAICRFFKQFKIQKDTNSPPNKQQLLHLIYVVIR